MAYDEYAYKSAAIRNEVAHPDFYVAAREHVEAADEHSRVAEHAFKHAPVCKRRRVQVVVGLKQRNERAERTAVSRKNRNPFPAFALFVRNKRTNHEQPHHEIAEVDGEEDIVGGD